MDGIPNSCTLPLATLHRNVPVILALLVCGACAQTYLMIDPHLIVTRVGTIAPVISSVVKEPSSPILVMDRPWETSLDYLNVVYAEEVDRLVMFYNTIMCTSSPQTQNRTVYVCDEQNNPPLTATLRAESQDGVHWIKPPLHSLEYNGSTSNNAIQLNQSAGMSDSNRGVYRDSFETDPSRRYKLVGNFFNNASGTGPLARWPGYHFGIASSPDGIHWHGMTDIALSLQARADTSNNVVYDETNKEWMLGTPSIGRMGMRLHKVRGGRNRKS